MLELLLQVLIQHPWVILIVILGIATGWLIALAISAMPKLDPNKEYTFKQRWSYNLAQIVGANLDRVIHSPFTEQAASVLTSDVLEKLQLLKDTPKEQLALPLAEKK